MAQRDTFNHLFAGGCGGTVGAILTCPLEVVKTRLQSSGVMSLSTVSGTASRVYSSHVLLHELGLSTVSSVNPAAFARAAPSTPPSPLLCLKTIFENEGPRSLFRGLGPNLVGVAPSRAIYFAAYSGAKEKLNTVFVAESTAVHICSAAFAGFSAITATNPIWLVKTRMQLNARQRGDRAMSALQCVRYVYEREGPRGFYRGMSASYAGISETIIHFVIYESLKREVLRRRARPLGSGDGGSELQDGASSSEKDAFDFIGMMCAAATSKTCASCIAYPHEVIRTRLREEGSRYRTLPQTVCLIVREEGYRALYRGLTTQMLRQIPNTAIMMATYELVVYLLNG
ncbi:solute carrier family 25 member 36-A-like [Lethenteron reissneri]|uniref:solute carrier family 25 member 36-A-like n=1 Tax=Lethenteron reissneri TaxID=7753 RepID=UPI002AB5FA81|nr:solute carrier family 25 member 36-A-like [Lethenteron reissneri]